MTKPKVVIFAGGFGTRLSEETTKIPKPLVEVGGMPILWHIMKIYYSFGYDEFVIALGYKGHLIKEWFSHYPLYRSNVIVRTKDMDVKQHPVIEREVEDWTIHLVDTGLNTQTGGRLKRLANLLDDTFMLTYGDGVGNVDVERLFKFHKSHGKLCTMTTVTPRGRFGMVKLDEHTNQIKEFVEKPMLEGTGTNAGFFVAEPDVLDYIEGDNTQWEYEPLQRLAADGQLMAYKHDGFWKPMDTLRDKRELEQMWLCGNAPWKLWKE